MKPMQRLVVRAFFVPLLASITIMAGSNACNRNPQEEQPARAGGSDDQTVSPVDSTRAVQSALAQFQPRGGAPSFEVSRFTRTDSVFVIEVVPKSRRVTGGGGLVRVSKSGAVKILKLYQ
jgi:hypothetical protein